MTRIEVHQAFAAIVEKRGLTTAARHLRRFARWSRWSATSASSLYGARAPLVEKITGGIALGLSKVPNQIKTAKRIAVGSTKLARTVIRNCPRTASIFPVNLRPGFLRYGFLRYAFFQNFTHCWFRKPT
jgi:hypothetical protein